MQRFVNLTNKISGGQLPHKNGPISLWSTPYMMTLKSFPNLSAPLSPINMTTMIGEHTMFPPTANSPR